MKLKDLQEKLHHRAPRVAEKVHNDLAFQIGTQIEVARARKGMTQKALADCVGTKQPSIARIESGASLPSISFLKKIANALDTSLEVTLTSPTTITISHGTVIHPTDVLVADPTSIHSQYAILVGYQSA